MNIVSTIEPAVEKVVETTSDNNEQSENYKSLREKMQERIKMLQSERISLKPHKQEAKLRVKDAKKDKNQHKDRSTQREVAAQTSEERSRAVMSVLIQSSTPAVSDANSVTETSTEGSVIEYGTIQNMVANAPPTKTDNLAGKSGAKMLRLKRMLEEAETKRKRLNELKSEAYNNVIKNSDRNANAKLDADNGVSFGGNIALNKLRAEQWSGAMKDASGDTGGAMDTEKIKKVCLKLANIHLCILSPLSLSTV